jgi:ABC-2 type transport system permease protein
MGWVSPFGGVVRYTYRMQIRRRSVWIVLIGLGSLTLLAERGTVHYASAHDAAVLWAIGVNTILPLAFGILLADRLPRDETLHVTALLTGAPISRRLHLLGTYVGTALATMTPILLIFGAGFAVMYAMWQQASLLPLTLAAFLTINLPGLLFVAAFSLAVPLFMPVPVYQVLFTGYWFWGNLLQPNVFGIPTLSDTLLTPLGDQRASYFFGIGISANGPTRPDPMLGIASIVLLALCATLALTIAWVYLRQRHERA